MILTNGPVRQGSHDGDIVVLHQELGRLEDLLGVGISTDEKQHQFFGNSTDRAVVAFQRLYELHRTDGIVRTELETLTRDGPAPGEILVRVDYSCVNYKDAIAVTGKGRIAREFPLIAGIDLAPELTTILING